MFSTNGIKEAGEASLALIERNACIEAEREFRKRELEPRLIEWAAEMHDLWSKFVKGGEFLRLKESLKTMGCESLYVHAKHFTLNSGNPEGESAFVFHADNFCNRSKPQSFSPVDYFYNNANLTLLPQEAFNSLLSDLDKAFEIEKHKYRYENDFEYRRFYKQQEAMKRRVENLKGETETAVFISLIIFLGYYMLPVVTGL